MSGGGDYRPPQATLSLKKIGAALNKYYPGIVKSLGEQLIPAAEYEFAAQQEFAPKEAELQADIYAQNAPKYAEAAGAADLAALQGSGGAAVRSADALSREIDPEFYATRAAASDKLGQLLSGMDPNKLTGAELENVSRGLGRYGARTGSLNITSPNAAIKNALTYGSALDRKRSGVANAISTAAGAAPAFRSGFDVFGQATGRQGTQAFGSGFAAPSTAVGNQVAAGQAATGLTGSLEQLRQQLMSQRRHYSDFVNQAYSASGQGFLGKSPFCFILREALGNKLPEKVEQILSLIFQNKKLQAGYLAIASRVVPLMRRDSTFKDWVTENFAKPLIKEFAL